MTAPPEDVLRPPLGVARGAIRQPGGARRRDRRRFFAPPCLGPKGWIGIRLDTSDGQQPDRTEPTALVERSYRLAPPRRLGARLG